MSTEEALIDGCFRVIRQRWGTWVSETSEGEKMVTSATEDLCIEATRYYLKHRQEGFTGKATTYAGTVDGKL